MRQAPDIPNGPRPAGPAGSGWPGPWSGANGGCCLEAKKLGGGQVALRQSAGPDGPALVLTAAEIAAFIAGAKAGLVGYLTEDL